MKKFYLMSDTRQQVRRYLTLKGDVKKLVLDCSSWADDNGNVTVVTPSVESGQASIGTATLASNVWSAPITTSQVGLSVIKLLIKNASYTEAVYIHTLTKDPKAATGYSDYGIVYG